MQTRNFQIYRYDPDQDAKPYMQSIEVQLDGTERMLLDMNPDFASSIFGLEPEELLRIQSEFRVYFDGLFNFSMPALVDCFQQRNIRAASWRMRTTQPSQCRCCNRSST